ncbi:MAG: esterase/lipase family protein [Pseudomonadota bacterium]
MAASTRVLLVHGLWYGRPGMLPLARRLRILGWQCELFGYSSVFGRAAENVQRLADRARTVGGDPLHFVGHSLGGLLILKMLAEAGGVVPGGRVVLLGSPLNGSAVARRMMGSPILKPWVGRAAELLDAGLDDLPGDREVAVIAGTSSLGAGRLFAALAKPHDGTVTVAETKVPGLADHLELPVSHTGLVLAGKVADAIDGFLRTGSLKQPSG